MYKENYIDYSIYFLYNSYNNLAFIDFEVPSRKREFASVATEC